MFDGLKAWVTQVKKEGATSLGMRKHAIRKGAKWENGLTWQIPEAKASFGRLITAIQTTADTEAMTVVEATVIAITAYDAEGLQIRDTSERVEPDYGESKSEVEYWKKLCYEKDKIIMAQHTHVLDAARVNGNLANDMAVNTIRNTGNVTALLETLIHHDLAGIGQQGNLGQLAPLMDSVHGIMEALNARKAIEAGQPPPASTRRVAAPGDNAKQVAASSKPASEPPKKADQGEATKPNVNKVSRPG